MVRCSWKQAMAVRPKAVELALAHGRLAAVADEMGTILAQAAFSPNIKERRDLSCALFDAHGEMVCHAAHIPVHVGSTPLSVRAAIEHCELGRGDVVMLNDPWAGGTHLPDLTLVTPVYLDGMKRPYGYVANRAHHADIGGHSPGSMALVGDIHQEGLRIPPVHLERGGRRVRETVELFLANTRVSEERLGDLDAQVASLRAGAARLAGLAATQGPARLTGQMKELQNYSARLVAALIGRLPNGRWQARDLLDDDGCGTRDIELRVAVERRGQGLTFDFTGSAAQVDGPLNANRAVTTSAVFYVVACLAGHEVPANSGMMEAVTIRTVEGSVVDCRFPAAVAGGNVETSQRIVDVVLKALAPALPGLIPAASCGTMTNIALGGWDPVRARFFSYYETVGGGAGAGPTRPGASALQTHMTNTRNTPVEVLESYYPIRVLRYGQRRRSGGPGKHRGGEGIEREIEVLVPAELTLLAERRRRGPEGLRGGGPGKAGRDSVIRKGRAKPVPSKTNLKLEPGDRLRVRTPGGGGWGKA